MGILIPDASLPTVTGLPWCGVNYFCTTREGGVSGAPWTALNVGLHTGDDAGHVLANRRLLRAGLPNEPLWLDQVHGAQVLDADNHLKQQQLSGQCVPPSADAAITTQRNRVLAVMTADCLPVVIASADGSALGVAHAGWRGLAAGVLEQTLHALRSRVPGGTPWRAWVGPAISQRHFEVGADVFQAFVTHDPHSAVFFAEKIPGQKWLADLPAMARRRLYQAGVSSIELSGYCSYSQSELFYSYRRAACTGRMVTVAWLSQ
ncbi:peptidoglycan editing factor PgeF [Alcaligenaceae bacterium]|nr:peptidoglycan editing factor PgeF [Alcaligenaceae bacterium]